MWMTPCASQKNVVYLGLLQLWFARRNHCFDGFPLFLVCCDGFMFHPRLQNGAKSPLYRRRTSSNIPLKWLGGRVCCWLKSNAAPVWQRVSSSPNSHGKCWDAHSLSYGLWMLLAISGVVTSFEWPGRYYIFIFYCWSHPRFSFSKTII